MMPMQSGIPAGPCMGDLVFDAILLPAVVPLKTKKSSVGLRKSFTSQPQQHQMPVQPKPLHVNGVHFMLKSTPEFFESLNAFTKRWLNSAMVKGAFDPIRETRHGTRVGDDGISLFTSSSPSTSSPHVFWDPFLRTTKVGDYVVLNEMYAVEPTAGGRVRTGTVAGHTDTGFKRLRPEDARGITFLDADHPDQFALNVLVALDYLRRDDSMVRAMKRAVMEDRKRYLEEADGTPSKFNPKVLLRKKSVARLPADQRIVNISNYDGKMRTAPRQLRINSVNFADGDEWVRIRESGDVFYASNRIVQRAWRRKVTSMKLQSLVSSSSEGGDRTSEDASSFSFSHTSSSSASDDGLSSSSSSASDSGRASLRGAEKKKKKRGSDADIKIRATPLRRPKGSAVLLKKINSDNESEGRDEGGANGGRGLSRKNARKSLEVDRKSPHSADASQYAVQAADLYAGVIVYHMLAAASREKTAYMKMERIGKRAIKKAHKRADKVGPNFSVKTHFVSLESSKTKSRNERPFPSPAQAEDSGAWCRWGCCTFGLFGHPVGYDGKEKDSADGEGDAREIVELQHVRSSSTTSVSVKKNRDGSVSISSDEYSDEGEEGGGGDSSGQSRFLELEAESAEREICKSLLERMSVICLCVHARRHVVGYESSPFYDVSRSTLGGDSSASASLDASSSFRSPGNKAPITVRVTLPKSGISSEPVPYGADPGVTRWSQIEDAIEAAKKKSVSRGDLDVASSSSRSTGRTYGLPLVEGSGEHAGNPKKREEFTKRFENLHKVTSSILDTFGRARRDGRLFNSFIQIYEMGDYEETFGFSFGEPQEWKGCT